MTDLIIRVFLVSFNGLGEMRRDREMKGFEGILKDESGEGRFICRRRWEGDTGEIGQLMERRVGIWQTIKIPTLWVKFSLQNQESTTKSVVALSLLPLYSASKWFPNPPPQANVIRIQKIQPLSNHFTHGPHLTHPLNSHQTITLHNPKFTPQHNKTARWCNRLEFRFQSTNDCCRCPGFDCAGLEFSHPPYEDSSELMCIIPVYGQPHLLLIFWGFFRIVFLLFYDFLRFCLPAAIGCLVFDCE